MLAFFMSLVQRQTTVRKSAQNKYYLVNPVSPDGGSTSACLTKNRELI
ncbi:MAG: hypothetical protein NTV55_10440 [Planctomycetota bacterium]|nr:hypothetical protein [Planctomycetota bacterium]